MKFTPEVYSLRRRLSEKSIYAFAKNYLSHHLVLTPSDAHHAIYAQLADIMERRDKRLAIAAPRGFGKSTLITLIYIIYVICYLKERYVLILSDTASQAEQILENIKKELTENEELRKDFPEVFEKEGRPKPPRWSQNQIETQNGIKIQALGSGQKPRGRRYGKYRPTLVIADDIETAENVATEESRDKIKRWFTSTVLMLGDENTNYVFLGTLYHPNCLLAEYLSPNFNLDWIKMTFKVIVSDSNHPELWSRWSEIYNNRQEYEGKRGKEGARNFYMANKELMEEGVILLWSKKWSYYELKVRLEEDRVSFYCELQNEPYDPRTAIYNIDKFHYIEKRWESVATFLTERQPWLEFYMSCDPCMGASVSKGDYAAVIVIARDCETGILYVVEADVRRITPQETTASIVNLCGIYRPRVLIIETNGFQKIMQDDLENEFRLQGIYVPVQSLNHGSSSHKDKRIHSLEPLINRGTIQFSVTHQRLLSQFRNFPNGPDDGPDALEMVVSNVDPTPIGIGGMACVPMNSVQSHVLSGIQEVKGHFMQVHNNWNNGADPNEPPLITSNKGPIIQF